MASKKIPERFVDFLFDTRLIHAWPHAKLRDFRFNRPFKTNTPTKFRLYLTVDLEGDYRNLENPSSALQFLPQFQRWADKNHITSTLYVQGSIAVALSDFRGIIDQHDMGLHGLHHEVWGRARWWQYSLGYPSLSLAEREKRLLLALETIEKGHLPVPHHFRAPYLNIKNDTLHLLKKYGFLSDSSAASFLGKLPLPRYTEGLWQIPVTARPYPQPVRKGWQRYEYPEFSLGNILNTPPDTLIETIKNVLTLQASRGFLGHIIILVHPWEFLDTPSLDYCSSSNFDRLTHVFRAISEEFSVTFATMNDLIAQFSSPAQHVKFND